MFNPFLILDRKVLLDLVACMVLVSVYICKSVIEIVDIDCETECSVGPVAAFVAEFVVAFVSAFPVVLAFVDASVVVTI